MNLRRAVTVVLGALCVSLLAACGGGEGEGSAGGRVKVVATYSILGDLVENVGGEDVELTTLVGPNGDAHTFEPAPSDNAELAGADVIFENGLGFETWLDDLYASSASDARRVVVSEGIDPLVVAGEEHGHGAKDEHAREHGEPDPHAWHDVKNAVVMVGAVRDGLVEADPGNADAYRANAEDYVAELEDLDAEVADLVGSVPEENRTLFTSHDTFGYFAERYGFAVDTALASASTETSDPSAGETADLVREIERSRVPAIFAENVSNPTVMENIADEAGVKLAPTLYTDALGGTESGGGTYVKMVRHNAKTISGALGG
jgi:zinc/manganese transport system substrate-binding protein